MEGAASLIYSSLLDALRFPSLLLPILYGAATRLLRVYYFLVHPLPFALF